MGHGLRLTSRSVLCIHQHCSARPSPRGSPVRKIKVYSPISRQNNVGSPIFPGIPFWGSWHCRGQQWVVCSPRHPLRGHAVTTRDYRLDGQSCHMRTNMGIRRVDQTAGPALSAQAGVPSSWPPSLRGVMPTTSRGLLHLGIRCGYCRDRGTYTELLFPPFNTL